MAGNERPKEKQLSDSEWIHIPTWRRFQMVVRRQPLTIVVPLIVCAVLIGIGTWGVIWGARAQEDSRMNAALYFASGISCELRQELQIAFITPLNAVYLLSSVQPQWSGFKSTFNYLANALGAGFGGVEGKSYYNKSVSQVAPGAVVTLERPWNSTMGQTLGQDMLDPSYLDRFGYVSVDDLVSRNISALGPVSFYDGRSPEIQVVKPIVIHYITNSSETFGRPATSSAWDQCTICYDATTESMFWGFVTVSLPWEVILEVFQLEQKLMSSGYVYKMTRSAYPVDRLEPEEDFFLLGSTHIDAAVVVEMEFHGLQFFLHVSKPGGWEQSWLPGVIVVVVIMSLLIGFLLMAVAVSSQERQMLLHAVAPTELIRKLLTSDDYLNAPPDAILMGSGTPADLMLSIIADVIAGREPHMKEVLMVRTAILKSADLFTPTDLVDRLQAQLDPDVARNLMRELGAGQGEATRLMFQRRSDQNSEGGNAAFTLHSDQAQILTRRDSGDCKSIQEVLMSLMSPAGFDALTTNPSGAARNPELLLSTGCLLNSSLLTSSQGVHPTDTEHHSSGCYSTIQSQHLSAANRMSLKSMYHDSDPSSHGHSSLSRHTSSDLKTGESELTTPHTSFDLKTGESELTIPMPPMGGAHVLPLGGSTVAATASGTTPSRLRRLALLPIASHFQTSSNHGRGHMEHVLIPNPDHAIQSQSYVASPGLPLYEEVEALLDTAFTSWEFNAFQLNDVTLGHPLSTLAFFLMSNLGLITKFTIKPVRLARFLRAIEAGYQDNPYHNRTHAADVLQTMHVVLMHGGLLGGYADSLTHLACLLAAAVHDLEHIGLTNDYIISVEHPLSLMYNDRSPMENHHLAAAFQLIRQPGLNFLSHMSREDRDKLRKTMIELVLGTDMKQHFSIHSQFSTSHSLNTAPAVTGGGTGPAATGGSGGTVLRASGNKGDSGGRGRGDSKPLHRISVELATLGASNLGDKLKGITTANFSNPLVKMSAASSTSRRPLGRAMSSTLNKGCNLGLNTRATMSGGGRASMTVFEGLPMQTTSSHQVTLRTGSGPQFDSQLRMSATYPSQLETPLEVHGNTPLSSNERRAREEALKKAVTPAVPIDEAERMLTLQVALKCADIGLIAEGLEVHKRWVYQLEEEFYHQGDLELHNGLPISPLFDRKKPGVSKSQPGFFDFIAVPMFHNFCAVFPGCRPLMDLTATNYHYWKMKAVDEAKEKDKEKESMRVLDGETVSEVDRSQSLKERASVSQVSTPVAPPATATATATIAATIAATTTAAAAASLSGLRNGSIAIRKSSTAPRLTRDTDLESGLPSQEAVSAGDTRSAGQIQTLNP